MLVAEKQWQYHQQQQWSEKVKQVLGSYYHKITVPFEKDNSMGL